MQQKSSAKVRNRSVAIATGHELTSKAAMEIIHDGGNVIDAAIAAHFAMMITEPCMASLGGAGMAMVAWNGQPIRTLDFFCQTPSASKEKLKNVVPINVDFGGTEETYFTGHGTIAIPGTMAGLWELHKLGASMPMSVLAEPAIGYCKNGIPLNAFQQLDLSLLQKIIECDPQGTMLFIEENQIMKVGSVIKNASLTDSLDYLSRSNAGEFYKGEIAKLFFDEHREAGNCKYSDWINYRARWSKPRLVKRKKLNVFIPDRPSFGGLSLDYFWKQYSDDLSSSDLSNAWADAYLKMRDVRLDKDKLLAYFGYEDSGQLSSRGTSHFSMLDNKGNAISLTSTIGEGAGYFIPLTGIHMNNMLGEEALMPDGIGSWRENERLDTMTTPTIVCDESNSPIGAIGSAGASRIPFILAQCMDKILNGDSLEHAIHSPRLHDDLNMIQIEPGLNNLNILNVDSRIWDEQSLYFGGVQAVWSREKGLEACGDPRREGHDVVLNN